MKRRISVLVLGFLLVALGTTVGCAKAADDAQITSQVQSRMFADPAIQSRQITVQSAGGVVTLSGAVSSDAERAAAGAQASAVDGVKTVVNNLAVMPPALVQAQTEPEPVKPAPVASSKPRPSTPRHLPSSASTAAAAPAAAVAPVAAAATQAPVTPPTPPPPQKVTIQAGTTMAVRLVDGVDSETAQPGQTFRATLDSPLAVDGEVAIPAGYDVEGHVVDVKSAGKFAGRSELVLQLDRIHVGGKTYSIQTNEYRRQGNSRGVNTAEKVGAGAAIGAIIGGIAGGGKGAAIGAAAGGGLGGGVQAATKGQQIKLPSETVLTFELQSPISVLPVQGVDHGRQKLPPPNQN